MKFLDIAKLVTALLFIARVVCKVMHIEGTENIQQVGALGGLFFFGILLWEGWNKRKAQKTDDSYK